ncbi:hypothetical protein [Campylobacter fetus]|uniref:hypothetical protein n=1 Tax=Campylobacter fetus TaxID=196 RepID=UPI00138E32E9|nr:hypothetical protein [Campylobacter fetus]
MTTEEMIEVMQAFERGEKIELSDVNANIWINMIIPEWNFENYKYRIKPKEEEIKTKFKIGDKIIIKTRCNGAIINPADIMNITEITEDYYKDEASVCLIISFADAEFIHVDECLWYWEYKTMYGNWERWNKRYTKIEIDEELSKSLSPSDRYIVKQAPIYQLGARLPEEKKNERV